MGKVLSLMTRPLRNFNVESRAHKITSQDKPVPAPKHKSSQLYYEQAMKDHPEAFQQAQIKNEQLDKYLKEVYVKSHDPILEQKQSSHPDRPLPLNKQQVEAYEYGVNEPHRIPLGKTTLKKALQFITDHQNNSKVHSSSKIAQEHNIPENTIKNILAHYKVYEVYVPEQRKVKAKFAGPSVSRLRMSLQQKKQLAAPIDKKGDT